MSKDTPFFRRLIVFALLFYIARLAYAQGTILFSNRNLTDPLTGAIYHAPVTLPDGSAAAGSAFTAGLFLVEPTGLKLIGTTFLRPGVGAGFWQAVGFDVPSVAPGAPATFRARVWETSAGSYESAIGSMLLHGEFATGQADNNLFVNALGHPTAPLPTPDLSGIQPLTLVPEPAAGALLILGGFICFAVWRGHWR
jgi:hypothetical protein